MAEYYRSVFSIAQKGVSGARLLDSARDAVREWVADDFGPRQPIADEPRKWTGGAGELSEIERRLDGESLAAFGIEWTRPALNAEIARWRMSVRLATEGDDVEVDIEIQGSEDRLLGLRDDYVAKLPSVPQGLLDEFDCALDGRRLSAKAERIEGGGESESFINDRLFRAERRIPLVVVSRDRDERGVDADNLQKNLLGLATVVSYDHRAAWDTARDIPRALRCYDGAVRLYSPGCARTDVAQQNPYWILSDALSLEKSGDLWRILRDECVNRVPRHTRRRLYAKVDARIQDAKREADFQVLVELERASQANQSDWTEIDPEFYEAYKSLDYPDEPPKGSAATYMRMAIIFRRQREILKTENKSLGREIENLKADSVKPAGGGGDADAPPDADPKSVLEAALKADESFDSLRFFPTAFEYAKDSQYRPASKVYNAFSVLNDCALALAKGPLGGKSVAQWLAERSVSYTPDESGPTNNDDKFRRDRTFLGVYMPAHVKMGDGDLRIHLRWEKSEGKWLIGYIGKHLPTANFPD